MTPKPDGVAATRPVSDIRMTGAAWVTEEELDALCEIAEQARRFLDLDWGYLDARVREGLERLVRAVEKVGT